MYRTSFKGTLLPFAGLMLMMAALMATSPAHARDLAYATYLPPSHPTTQGIKLFTELVSKKTDGEVTFAVYPSASLAGGKAMLASIRQGIIDAGFIVGIYTPGDLPANSLLSDFSFLNTNPQIAAAAVTDTILNDCKQCLKEYQKNNVQFLGTYSTTPYMMMCKGDFSGGMSFDGLRIRVAGGEFGKWVSELGGIPVDIANNEAYQAMQRNQLDCVHGATAWLDALSLNEVVGSVIDQPMGAYYGGALFDVRTSVWEDLSKQEKQALLDATPAAIARAVYGYIEQVQHARKAAEKKGVKYLEPSPELKKKHAAFAKSQMERVAETARGRGVKNPEKLLESLQKNYQKWTDLIGGKEITEDEYTTLLKEHLYSKISL